MPYYLIEGQSENEQERPCESYTCSDCPESQCYRSNGYCITKKTDSSSPPSALCPPSSPEPKMSWPPSEPGEEISKCDKFVNEICSTELNSFSECQLCVMDKRVELNDKGCDGEKSVEACRNLTQGKPIEEDIDLSEKLEELMNISDNFTSVLMDQLKEINDKTSNKLYSDNDIRYVRNISKMSLMELGEPKNSDELDFMENVIINFLEIPDNKMGDLFSNYCNEDLNINILLTLAIFYNRNRTDFNNIRDNNLVNVDRLLNRLGRYLPDVFQKILTGMKMCPGSSDKYVVLEHIYKKMFKFNETNVDLGLMNGITSIFRYLKEMKTIEMVVIIIAFAFVVSKIFDMFRVKVDV